MSGDLEPAGDDSNPRAVVTVTLAKARLAAAVINNAAKAIGHLCGAGTKYVVGRIEDADAERHALSRARIRIYDETGIQMSQQIKVAVDQAQAAFDHAAKKILRGQDNVDGVAHLAIEDLRNTHESSDTATSSDEIGTDWLNQFDEQARLMSTQEMRVRFSKLLAGEIRRPGTFSIRSIKLLGELDSATATLFRRAASMTLFIATETWIDARIPSFGRHASSKGVEDIGLTYAALVRLQEAGLVAQLETHLDYAITVVQDGHVPFTFNHLNKPMALFPTGEVPEKIDVPGVMLTRAASELLPVIDMEVIDEFESSLQTFFAKSNVEPKVVTIKQK